MPSQFVDDEDVRLIGIEAGGEGVGTSKHAATLTMGSPGVLHGSFSYLLQDDEGQIIDPHSISAGYALLSYRAVQKVEPCYQRRTRDYRCLA